MLAMIFLSDAERDQLIAQHRRERDKRICDRIKAVLLFDKGWSIPSIAEALLLSEDAIRGHIAEYRESKKLKTLSWLCLDFLPCFQLSPLILYWARILGAG